MPIADVRRELSVSVHRSRFSLSINKKAAQLERPFSLDWFVALTSRSYCGSGLHLFRLELLPVVLDEIQLSSMTVAGVKIELLHLGIRLVKVPLIVIEPINRRHYSSAMPSSGTVHIKLSGLGIVYNS